MVLGFVSTDGLTHTESSLNKSFVITLVKKCLRSGG